MKNRLDSIEQVVEVRRPDIELVELNSIWYLFNYAIGKIIDTNNPNPWATKRSARLLPINPATPVIKTVLCVDTVDISA
jgi:hypothetical protein